MDDVILNTKVNRIINAQKQLILTPVGFRDASIISRSNTNQTSTSRYHYQPQFDFQDIVLAYTNYYPGGTFVTETPNTNLINVKSTIELNGILIPVFFNGKRTITIDGGGIVFSDPIGAMVTSTDQLYVRTYTDAGVGGYTPCIAGFNEVLNGSLAGNGIRDGVTYGQDLTDAGTVTLVSSGVGYVPSAIFGIVKGNVESYLISGDSIADGSDDSAQLLGVSGYISRALLVKKIGHTKVTEGGEWVHTFLTSLYERSPLCKYHTGVICEYGANDFVNGQPLATIKADLLKAWKFYATKGLKVYQTTLLPKTNSTDNWMTLTNQTLSTYESARLGLNTWLRDNSANGAIAQSAGNLSGLFDPAIISEDTTTGKWKVFSTPIYSGQVQSAGANYIVDPNLDLPSRTLDNGAVIKITGGTGAGQVLLVLNNYNKSQPYVASNWTTVPDATSTYEVYYIPTNDGTHPTSYNHSLLTESIKV